MSPIPHSNSLTGGGRIGIDPPPEGCLNVSCFFFAYQIYIHLYYYLRFNGYFIFFDISVEFSFAGNEIQLLG